MDYFRDYNITNTENYCKMLSFIADKWNSLIKLIIYLCLKRMHNDDEVATCEIYKASQEHR